VLPLYYLAKLEGIYYQTASECKLCAGGSQAERAWV